MNTFRLISLKTHDKTSRNLDIVFIDKNKYNFENDQIFTTLIIGNNGAGKSYILNILTSIFRYLEALKQNKKLSIDVKQFKIEYILDSDIYEVNNFQSIELLKN